MSHKNRENTPLYKVFKKIINLKKLIYTIIIIIIIIFYINLSDHILLNFGYKLDINVLY